ncbi:MAG: NADH-ubiquinone oxidoreductase-F iron-sulfur binding region domain-containing protein [Candidatus Thermoplasmatota archaeon]|jgi:NADH-quinone oxidoreductase subunit F|nr:NADH-ubiquinone oxidoreductase-F iron-sulfur binding region domain-containing protein [Candidatus Thermoplasmatota archaeon]
MVPSNKYSKEQLTANHEVIEKLGLKKLKSLKELENLIEKTKKERQSYKGKIIVVSGGTCGRASGSQEVVEAVKEGINKTNLSEKVHLRATGCIGFCDQEPIILILPDRIFYPKVKPSMVLAILEKTIDKNQVIKDFLFEDQKTGKKIEHFDDIPFYKKQVRLISGNNESIDPSNILDYIGSGGYSALFKILKEKISPKEIIKMVTNSGLRGRGGAGFPTGKKWESASEAKSVDGIKYVICNADEGDPGAYANRGLLEANPHCVIEGMIIGAYSINANQGYIYVRAEYPLAIEYFELALKSAEALGLLGENILGSDFSFNIKISKGGGAFVCGESTALMASIEGKAGEPRVKHIHSTTSGLFERPTVLNNVETWANIPLIINNGVDWYTKIGTQGSKGTKIFSVVGKVNNTGLVEVPMGVTIREIVQEIGGGVKQNKKFKAVQIGGPSGGCIPEQLMDLPIDYDSLTYAGAMMGSGGMIVMDENTCMVDVAKYFVNFLKNESCGKCTPCREGLVQMHGILTEITEGKGKESDLELLQELAELVHDSSLCQLGITAPNPIITTIKYFKDEYIAHIKEKKCPAKVCKALISYNINIEKCTGCHVCARNCPVDAIRGEIKQKHEIDHNKCIKCGICQISCKFDAVEVT